MVLAGPSPSHVKSITSADKLVVGTLRQRRTIGFTYFTTQEGLYFLYCSVFVCITTRIPSLLPTSPEPPGCFQFLLRFQQGRFSQCARSKSEPIIHSYARSHTAKFGRSEFSRQYFIDANIPSHCFNHNIGGLSPNTWI